MVSLDRDERYELFAMTVHVGNPESGHYVAYAKRDHVWYCFNDEHFLKVSEEEALRQEAYLLFYRCI